jgi:hypothetical protein
MFDTLLKNVAWSFEDACGESVFYPFGPMLYEWHAPTKPNPAFFIESL